MFADRGRPESVSKSVLKPTSCYQQECTKYQNDNNNSTNTDIIEKENQLSYLNGLFKMAKSVSSIPNYDDQIYVRDNNNVKPKLDHTCQLFLYSDDHELEGIKVNSDIIILKGSGRNEKNNLDEKERFDLSELRSLLDHIYLGTGLYKNQLSRLTLKELKLLSALTGYRSKKIPDTDITTKWRELFLIEALSNLKFKRYSTDSNCSTILICSMLKKLLFKKFIHTNLFLGYKLSLLKKIFYSKYAKYIIGEQDNSVYRLKKIELLFESKTIYAFKKLLNYSNFRNDVKFLFNNFVSEMKVLYYFKQIKKIHYMLDYYENVDSRDIPVNLTNQIRIPPPPAVLLIYMAEFYEKMGKFFI